MQFRRADRISHLKNTGQTGTFNHHAVGAIGLARGSTGTRLAFCGDRGTPKGKAIGSGAIDGECLPLMCVCDGC
jgi:hypothetical protein